MKTTSYLLGLLIAVLTLALPAAASARDRDRDGLSDGWEKRYKLSVKRNSANGDPDRDKVDNANEYRQRTSPRDADSDNDGTSDGREDSDRDKLNNRSEDATGNDPRDRDTDNDGAPDGNERAGTVVSFKGGVLTIDLANGSSVRGRTGEGTALACKSEAQAERSHRKRGSKAGKSSADFPGYPEDEGEIAGEGEEPGDEPGEEPGDEPGDESGDEPDDEEGDSDDEQPRTDTGPKSRKGCSVGDFKRGLGVQEATLARTAGGLEFKRITLLRGR